MIDFSDVSFLIPVRLDSINRLENILTSIEFLLSHFKTNVIVLEASRYNNSILQKLLPHDVKYLFVEDWDPIFHRTKYINQLFAESHTPIVSIWDADIVIPVCQMMEAIVALRSGNFEVSFPYEGSTFDVTEFIRDSYIESPNIDLIEKNTNKLSYLYGKNLCGGALFITSKAFIDSGKEDERFYGWGPEDWNRVAKWNVLGYRIYRSKGALFHLSHPRDINGHHSWEEQKKYSFFILEQTRKSLQVEILNINDYDKN